ncbi:phosphotransferase [Paenibacillus sp. 79R4]|uniref:phosphotransferase family protein n=1 Tax=Paenibacillus sp. 79R4 TaxID=2212847 RepID=UPI0015B8E4EB|nr:phosphotransferase [Paenibacillus sp. 79R4]NWL89768.1 phosphotransferase [Paenibacillus sp. 79R4]
MTTEIFFSSPKLGEITDGLLQRVLHRFNLGELISFAPTSKGVGQQTLFLQSSTGEYVLKGNPLYPGQFIEEKYYIEHLRSMTSLPVPLVYIVDEAEDILGWSYAIMSRLSGVHLSDPATYAGLSETERDQVASLLADTLAQMQCWKADSFGEYKPLEGSIAEFPEGYTSWLYKRIRYWLSDAGNYSMVTAQDLAWMEDVLRASEQAFNELSAPTFVMGDYKLDNLLFQRQGDAWSLSGIFDFTTGYFGDGLADVSRIMNMYLDRGEREVATRFIRKYYLQTPSKSGFAERFRVHMLHQRVLDWGCAYAINEVTWDRELSFSAWVSPFIELPEVKG